MMNDAAKETVRLIREGEGQFVEFKKKANHPEKIIREVVAFANSGGGHLFIGIDDNGSISGLKYPEDEEFVLTKAIRELCKPTIDFDVEFTTINDVVILHYHIKEGSKKPYFAFLEKKHKYGKAFMRVKDHSIQASYEVRQILKRSNQISQPIIFEEKTRQLFEFFRSNQQITLSQYMELSGLDKELASNKLINLALSGALKIEPREGGDVFSPAE